MDSSFISGMFNCCLEKKILCIQDESFVYAVVVIPVSVTTLLVAILTSICVVVGGICCICKKKTCRYRISSNY